MVPWAHTSSLTYTPIFPTFFKIKNVDKIKKTLKNVKNVTKINSVKSFFYIYGLDYRVQTSARFVKFLLGSIPPHFLSSTLPFGPSPHMGPFPSPL